MQRWQNWNLIRIEPDWNVKLKQLIYRPQFRPIRIEPDWNVKP